MRAALKGGLFALLWGLTIVLVELEIALLRCNAKYPEKCSERRRP